MVSPAPRNASAIRLKLPALADPLPDYIDQYRQADEPVLQILLASLLNLIQDAEEMLEWHRVSKRLECYRFDHLTFSQKFVRFNSTTKNRVSEGIYKSFREILECERRLAVLNEQLNLLNNELLPAAKQNAELKQLHREWPRPDRFPSPLDRIDNSDGTDGVDGLEFFGEGITRRRYCGIPQVRLPSAAVEANSNGVNEIITISTEGAAANRNNFDDNYIYRLGDELRRLQIARGLQLRLLSRARIGIADIDEESVRSTISKLHKYLITAAQAYSEAQINQLSPERREEECLRISCLSDHQYAAEVFGVAQVKSWELTSSDEDAAEHELRHVLDMREAMAGADQACDEQSSGLPAVSVGAVFLSQGDIDAAVESGPDAIVAQLLRLQCLLEEKEEALRAANSRYNNLSATQKYVRRKESKSWKTIRENKESLSQDIKNIRVSINILREKFKGYSCFSSCS